MIPAVVRVPAYRRFIAAAMAANAGLWLFETALFWLVLKQTGSSTAVGLVLTALLVPLVLFAIPGGMLTDRFGPHRLMMISCTGWTLMVLAMAFLATRGPVTYPIALTAALLVGCFDSIWTIPGQNLVGRVVEPRHMASAIALSPLQFGIGRIVGGLSGGALVTVAGPPITFLVAAGSPPALDRFDFAGPHDCHTHAHRGSGRRAFPLPLLLEMERRQSAR